MRWIAAVAVLAGLSIGAGGLAQSTTVGVEDVWSRAQIAGRNGAVYLTLTGKAGGDRLTGATSPIAARVELHESIIEQGVAKMREIKGLAVPAGTTITLQPGGLHIMLMNLKQPLKEGETVPLTLLFEKAGQVETTARVTKAGAAAMDHGPGHPHRH